MFNKKILIIGDVFTDYHLDFQKNELRLGGVFHSARVLNALKIEYYLGVFCSSYQINYIQEWANKLNCNEVEFLGKYINRPNTMLISDSYEIGDQEYKNILYPKSELEYTLYNLEDLINRNQINETIIYPGDYNFTEIINMLNKNRITIHLDGQYMKGKIPKGIQTLFISSSRDNYEFIEQIIENKGDNIGVNTLVYKQNRGGSSVYKFKNNEMYTAPSYIVKTEHSVGVGDVFNTALLSFGETNEKALVFASKISAAYATTLEYKEFLFYVDKIRNNSISWIPYPILPWKERTKINIYLAAPDFPNTATRKLADIIEKKLNHHNFSLIRPIMINGLITDETDNITRKIIYAKDLEHITQSTLCIALLDEQDTGTAVEIGMFNVLNKPIIGYSSLNKKFNNFLFHTLSDCVDNLLDLIENVFKYCEVNK